MKRKIYETLLEWKRTSNGKSAVMLDGARRVGKSYIAEEFAKNEYAAYLVVDFATAPRKVKRYFEEYLNDLDTFFMYLCSAYRKTLVPGNSVIIFDISCSVNTEVCSNILLIQGLFPSQFFKSHIVHLVSIIREEFSHINSVKKFHFDT